MYFADRLRCAGHGVLLSEGGGYRGAANYGNTAADGDAATSALFRADRSMFAGDRFHPSSRGYAAIADALLPAVRDAVEARQAAA